MSWISNLCSWTSGTCNNKERRIRESSKTYVHQPLETLIAFRRISTKNKRISGNILQELYLKLKMCRTVTLAKQVLSPQLHGQKLLSPSPSTADRPQPAPHGSATLQGHQGKELNLDGTPKAPYRHLNHAANRQETEAQQAQQVQQIQDFPDETHWENFQNRGKNVASH